VKVYDTEQIRNVALVGQRGCGKTSLADAVAFSAGITNRLGKVDEGTSLSDFTDEEISRKTSIGLSILTCPWKNIKINLMDLPGHPDFIGELIVGLNVSETAVVVLNANAGFEVGTEIQYKYVEKFNLSRIFFINKIEKEHVKTAGILSQLQERFGMKIVPLQIPMGEGLEFKGIVDLIKMKSVTFDAKGAPAESDIPADLKGAAEEAHQKMIEAIAEADDTLLEKFFDKGELSHTEILDGLKKGVKKRTIYPVLYGSADRNAGVSALMDILADYMSSPADISPVNLMVAGKEEVIAVNVDAKGKPLAYVFKLIAEQHIGEISLFKVISGKISQGLDLINHTNSNSERVGQVYSISGKERSETEAVVAGDIAAFVKLKTTKMGDTLGEKDYRLKMPKVEFPEPVMDTGVKPRAKGDEEKLGMGLSKLRDEDPTFIINIEPALHQTVLLSQGSTHTEIIVEKLKKKFGVDVDLFKPRIPYRETIKTKTELQHKYKKQSGGRGQYGDVYLRLEPNKRGTGFQFVNDISGGVIPGKYIPSVEKGVIEAMIEGGLSGSPVVDVIVAVYYGSYHEVDSSDMAFKIAASMAFKEGFLKCNPILLEPIDIIEVLVPDDFTGDVMGNLSGRRGRIMGMDPDGRYQRIKATVPEAELYNYSVDLRSMTSGQGVYSRKFSHYEEVPREIMPKVIEEIKKSKEE
jgi:elongation factor G